MATSPLSKRLVDLPYFERQLLALASAKSPPNWMDRAKAAAAPSTTNTSVAAVAVGFGLPVVIGAAVIGAAVGYGVSKAISRAGVPKMNPIRVSLQDLEGLTFPPGHPKVEVLYVGHPTSPPVYYTLAQFHRSVFEHKVSEAIELLAALGASTIKVEHRSGWSREFASRVNTPLSGSGETATAETTASRNNEQEFLFAAELPGHNQPQVPEKLAWYPHESSWQMIAQTRIRHGLSKFSLDVTYQDDFGVNASLQAWANGAGFDLGGSFEDHQSTTWTLAGLFGAKTG
ncbi:hypothetical protein [Roseomonas sp. WA12]